MKKLVSIIVPIYNSEKYLDKCISSIINQSYDNIEVLLIDDGSTDSSKKICKKYYDIDSRIKYYYKKNSGVSSTRNYGLEKASGEYICFIDSDDYIETGYVDKLLSNMSIDKYDLSVVGIRCEDEKDKYGKDEIIDVNSAYIRVLNDINFFGYPVNKLYKKEIIDSFKIKFNTDIYWGEDLLFNLEYLRHCKKIIVNPTSLYVYVNNMASMTKSNKISKKQATIIDACNLVIEEYKSYCNNLIIWAYKFYYVNLCILEEKCLKVKSDVISIDFVKKEKKKVSNILLKSKVISSYEKIKIIINCIFPRFYYIIRRKKNN